MHTHITRTTSIFVALSMLVSSVPSVIAQEGPTVAEKMAAGEPYEQEFVLTAYYSPLPDQCCYIKGSLEADKILNGQGTNGADGTEVYPGMIAAPPSYLFGTRIVLPGLGTMTVHDRGGAIQEWDDSHRIDVWAGAGEEGLARALAFGVQRIRGTVYPPASEKPAESFDLAALPAPLERIRPYAVSDTGVIVMLPAVGEKSVAVKLLQEQLKNAGYMQDVTGLFGPVTREALAAFYGDMGLADAPDSLTENGSVYLQAMAERKDAKAPVAAEVDSKSSPQAIAQAKRTLRFLGHFDGRTNGTFDQALFDGILAFQQSEKLVGDAMSPGAGRIGPKTRARIVAQWTRKLVSQRAEHILLVRKVDKLMAERGDILTAFMGKGARSDSVKQLQSELVKKGFLKKDQVTGLFGDATEKALVAFQIAEDIIKTGTDQGAGYAGPATLRTLREAKREELIRIVRAEGWDAI